MFQLALAFTLNADCCLHAKLVVVWGTETLFLPFWFSNGSFGFLHGEVKPWDMEGSRPLLQLKYQVPL